MDINEIRNILKKRRIELGLTMAEVAKAVGVSEATVSRWESGNIANMKRSRIAALAKILQIPPTVIMGYDSNVLDDIPLAILKHYQEQGLTEDEMIESFANFREAELKDAMSDLNKLQELPSPETIEVANAYAKAEFDKQNIVRLTLGLPLKKYADEADTPYLLPNAAHEIEGASQEDKDHDESIMDDDNF